MKIIFLGTSQIGIRTLYSIANRHQIVAAITQPDKLKNRSGELIPSPIAQICEKENIKVYKPEIIENNLIEELKNLESDLFITFSYGVILKKDFFSISKKGGINIHPSLLPKLRGPSPIKTAILNGFKKTGITIQNIKTKVDSGDVLYQFEFDINPEDDASIIEEKVSCLSSAIILSFLEKFEKNEIKSIPQNDDEATYSRLFKKQDGLINWNDKGENIINKIRAFVNWPIAYSFIDNNRINIYKARINNHLSIKKYKDIINGKIILADKKAGITVKSSDSLINIEVLQQKSKKKMDWKSFLNGYKNLNEKIFLME